MLLILTESIEGLKDHMIYFHIEDYFIFPLENFDFYPRNKKSSS